MKENISVSIRKFVLIHTPRMTGKKSRIISKWNYWKIKNSHLCKWLIISFRKTRTWFWILPLFFQGDVYKVIQHELPKELNTWPAKPFCHLRLTAIHFKKWEVKNYLVLFSGTENLSQNSTEFPNSYSWPLMNCFLSRLLQTSKLAKWALWLSEGSVQSLDSSS